MKKRVRGIILTCVIAAVVAGCGKEGTSSKMGTKQNSVTAVLEAGMAAEDEKNGVERKSGLNEDAPAPETEVSEPVPVQASGTEGIDVDLTALSSTMVYAEVYQMMVDPESYVGKTVKMGGIFSDYEDEETGKTYFACIIMDATACCSQGIEFVLTEDYEYPRDYPKVGDDIEVTGVFETYEEDGNTYCTLTGATLGKTGALDILPDTLKN